MNTKLIFRLSLFGLAMAIATICWIPGNIELYFWLVIFIICAWIIAKKCKGHYFQHGFWVSILNCIWIIILHVLFFRRYMAHHPEMFQMKMASWPFAGHMRRNMLFTGPIIGVISGIILGAFAWIASKLVRKTPPAQASKV